MSDEPMNLHQRILAIMEDLKPVPKSSRNKFENYDFASRDDIICTIRPLLIKHGVVFVLNRIDDDKFEARYINADDPNDMLYFGIHGTGHKVGHKSYGTPQSYGSAISYTEKYAHRTMFQIDTGDRDDPDGHKQDDPDPKEQKATDDQAKIKEECRSIIKQLGVTKEEGAKLWAECGKDYNVYLDALNEMADKIAEDEAKQMKEAGQ